MSSFKGEKTIIYNCVILRFIECEFGKYHHRPSKSKKVARVPGKYTELNKYDLHYCQRVSDEHSKFNLSERFFPLYR